MSNPIVDELHDLQLKMKNVRFQKENTPPSETPCSTSPRGSSPASSASPPFAYSATPSFSPMPSVSASPFPIPPDPRHYQDSHYLHPQRGLYKSQALTNDHQYTHDAAYESHVFTTTGVSSVPHGQQATGFTPQSLDCIDDEIGFAKTGFSNRMPDEEFLHKSYFEYPSEDVAQPLKSVSTFSNKVIDSGLKLDNEQEHDILTGQRTMGFSHVQTVDNEEIKNLFQFIDCYKPREVEMGTFLRPFIPDYIPTVGSADEFIKVPRPDGLPDYLGLKVLDESGPIQSDPAIVALQMRAAAMQLSHHSVDVASIEGPERNSRKVDAWIDSMRDLQRLKPLSSVTYSKPMPDMEQLIKDCPKDGDTEMQFLGALEDMELSTFVDLCCSSLGIPVYKSRVESLHCVFALHLELKRHPR